VNICRFGLAFSVLAMGASQAQAIPSDRSAWTRLKNNSNAPVVLRPAAKYKNLGDIYFKSPTNGDVTHLGEKTYLYPGQPEVKLAPGDSVLVYFDTTGKTFSYTFEFGGQVFTIRKLDSWSLSVPFSDSGAASRIILESMGFRKTNGPALLTVVDEK